MQPSATSLARRVLRRLLPVADKPIWHGVYDRYKDAPVTIEGYATPAYLDAVEASAAGYVEAIAKGLSPNLWHDGLALLGGTLSANRKQLRIVDFGGGLGTGYLQLRAALPEDVLIRYDIVETPQLVDRGKRLFADADGVDFHERIEGLGRSDIVYVNSALQYVTDPAATIGQLAKLKADWILLDRAAIGDVPSFVSLQTNVPGKLMRYWFLNEGEVGEWLAREGYRLLRNGPVGPVYDQSNLPATHRIGRMNQLLFGRAPSTEGVGA